MNRNKLLEEIGRTRFDNAMKYYPIFREEYRQTLNDKIYNHFQHDTICMGDDRIWLDELAAEMALIMPKYNLLYDSINLLDKFDPLMTYEFWREFKHDGTNSTERDVSVKGTSQSDGTSSDTTTTEESGTRNTENNGTSSEKLVSNSTDSNNGTSNTKESTTDEAKDYFSDTPQGNLYRDEENPDVDTLQYLSTYDRKTGKGTRQSDTTMHDEGTSNTTEDRSGTTHDTGKETDKRETIQERNGTTHEEGTTTSITDDDVQGKEHHDDDTHEWGSNGGSYSELVQKYRELAISVDDQIVDELMQLFATTYDPMDLMGSSRGYEPRFLIGAIPYYYFNRR